MLIKCKSKCLDANSLYLCGMKKIFRYFCLKYADEIYFIKIMDIISLTVY